jgi:hypothetical protein
MMDFTLSAKPLVGLASRCPCHLGDNVVVPLHRIAPLLAQADLFLIDSRKLNVATTPTRAPPCRKPRVSIS